MTGITAARLTGLDGVAREVGDAGVADFTGYAFEPGQPLHPDYFLD